MVSSHSVHSQSPPSLPPSLPSSLPPSGHSNPLPFRLTVEEGLAALRGAQRGAMRARSPDYRRVQTSARRSTTAADASGDVAVASTPLDTEPLPLPTKMAPKPALKLKRPNNRYGNAAGVSAAAALRSAPPVWGELKVPAPTKTVEAVPAKTSKLLTAMQQRAAQRDQLKQVGIGLCDHLLDIRDSFGVPRAPSPSPVSLLGDAAHVIRLFVCCFFFPTPSSGMCCFSLFSSVRLLLPSTDISACGTGP